MGKGILIYEEMRKYFPIYEEAFGRILYDPRSLLISLCTALPKAEFFIEPPPDTQRRRRRGERGIGVTRGSYLLLTSLSPSPLPPTRCAPAALPGAALSGHAPPP